MGEGGSDHRSATGSLELAGVRHRLDVPPDRDLGGADGYGKILRGHGPASAGQIKDSLAAFDDEHGRSVAFMSWAIKFDHF